MPPREASHSFPDHFITVDYDHAGPILAPHDAIGGNGGGGFGGNGDFLAGAGTGDDGNTEGITGVGLTVGSEEFESMITAQQIQQENGMNGGGGHAEQTNTSSGEGQPPASIENDPLSLGSVSPAMEGTPPSAQASHSSGGPSNTESAPSPPSIQSWNHYSHEQYHGNFEGISAVIVEHHNGVTHTSGGQHYSPTTVSQHATPSSTFGHQVTPMAIDNYRPQPAHRRHVIHQQPGNQHRNTDPLSIDSVTSSSQRASSWSAQPQESHPEGPMSNGGNSIPRLVAQARSRIAMAQQRSAQVQALAQAQAQAQAQQPRHSRRNHSVPRASSFGGFPSIATSASRAPATNPRGISSINAVVGAGDSPPSSIVTPPSVSRSNSVASSITASITGWTTPGLGNSLAGNHRSPTNTVAPHGHSSSQNQLPLETVQPSLSNASPHDSFEQDGGTSPASSAPSTPRSPKGPSMSPEHSRSNGTLGRNRFFGLSTSIGQKLSPIENTTGISNSPASLSYAAASPFSLAHAGSVLDQTSFPEDDDFSGLDEDDKYSPISKLDLNRKWEEDGDDDIEGDKLDHSKAVQNLNGTFATMDTTMDTTYDESVAIGTPQSPMLIDRLKNGESDVDQSSKTNDGLEMGASHVIHEELPFTHASAASSSVFSTPSPSSLRPRSFNQSHGITNTDDMSQCSSHTSGAAGYSQGSRRIVRNEAFEMSPGSPGQVSSENTSLNRGQGQNRNQNQRYRHQHFHPTRTSDISVASNDGSVQLNLNPTSLSFGPETNISDLTYFAERGCIVDLLAALTNPHLKTLGTRMLADYAKMPHRRVAVASNVRILEFVQSTALEIGLSSRSPVEHMQKYTSVSWLGREYAVETVRSLTATEESDRFLMNASGLLQMLALVARGGPFVQKPKSRNAYTEEGLITPVPPPTFHHDESTNLRALPIRKDVIGVASDKARLHACIAIMNLSCGKSNKIEITNVPDILEAMRDVMLGLHFSNAPKDSSSPPSLPGNIADEARLKATTCIKNLSNADANDAALLGTPGLVETLGHVAEATCHPETGATTCTTHACLALMNLSISKANKHRVFRTPGVMDALMAVITRTVPKGSNSKHSETKDASFEARVKACSALSNLAIGYDNKIPMFNYPGFVESILTVIRTDKAEARTKACSILWSFAAEMKNQVPVVQRGDILPALVAVAKEDEKTEARFKCVAALTLLAESLENAVPLLHAGSLEPLMNVLQEAGPDPTQWKGQTASWCVGFLMNMAQCDDVVPALLSEGIVDLLAPLLTLDHYQSLKAAMAVTFVCRYDTGDKTYNLLRQTENVIPKIISLLHNTLSGRGGSGYKYGVFTLRSSVGCIASLASGPDFMKERIATGPVFESLLRVVSDFCVNGGTPGAIVGGGRDDTRSATLAVRALSLLTGHLIPEPGCSAMPFGPVMDERLITALRSFELSAHPDITDETRAMAESARIRIQGGKHLQGARKDSICSDSSPADDLIEDVGGIGLSFASKCCGMHLHALPESSSGDYTGTVPVPLPLPANDQDGAMEVTDDAMSASSSSVDGSAVRTFLLTDSKTGRRFAVPTDPTGGRAFNDNRIWCYRRGRWCKEGEEPDPNFQWSDELQAAYLASLSKHRGVSPAASQG